MTPDRWISALEQNALSLPPLSAVLIYGASGDMQLDVFADGELLESSTHPFFAQSEANGFGDAEIVDVSIDKTSALPGETVLVDVDVVELLELCTTQFVLTASDMHIRVG